MKRKYIVVTGGVISGIGKGVTTASAGFFLAEKYSIAPIKLDGYLNIDPGTMNPHEHGEVFVLGDGAEVDMDFGHYERFLGVDCNGAQSISMGKIYAGILEKERRGDFLGKTVQMVPHVTDYICERLDQVCEQSGADICMIEVGGTVGDIEVELYLEAVRQLRGKCSSGDFMHIHLTYVPIPGGVDEQKTKPTQQSVNLLQSKGLFPDIIVARGLESLTDASKAKIALFSNLPKERVFSIPDLPSVYGIPELLEEQGIRQIFKEALQINIGFPKKLEIWNKALSNELHESIQIGIVGKYTALEDSYSSVVAALEHAGLNLGIQVNISFINTREKDGIEGVKLCDACIIPGGFGDTAVENMIQTLRYIREKNIPCLGICLGLQLMVIEFMRNVVGNTGANSLEFDKNCPPHDVVTLLDSQKNVVNLGGTMRLGKQSSILEESTIKQLYHNSNRVENDIVHERFRHRFEVHPLTAEILPQHGFKISAKSQQEGIVQFIELEKKLHPYYVGTQSHPELTSRLEDPAPLFVGLLRSCIKKES